MASKDRNIKVEVHRVELDPDGKQILLFKGCDSKLFAETVEAIRKWLLSDSSVMALNLSDGVSVEFVKL